MLRVLIVERSQGLGMLPAMLADRKHEVVTRTDLDSATYEIFCLTQRLRHAPTKPKPPDVLIVDYMAPRGGNPVDHRNNPIENGVCLLKYARRRIPDTYRILLSTENLGTIAQENTGVSNDHDSILRTSIIQELWRKPFQIEQVLPSLTMLEKGTRHANGVGT